MKIELKFTKNIKDYREILTGLIDDFGYIYWHAILVWCDIIDDKFGKDNFWKVWAIAKNDENIGICGLYSLDKFEDELWLGWFGILPEYRNQSIGKEVLSELEIIAKNEGAKYIYSYVDEEGKPLSFYLKNGYTIIGTVKDYLNLTNNKFNKDSFENLNDWVIKKDLYERNGNAL